MFENPIIAVGTGRCGSSLLASMLWHLGVHMGDDLISSTKDNPAGHYEDRDFHSLHMAMGSGKLSMEKFMNKAKGLIHTKGVQGRRWGWKTPSTAHFIEEYLEIVPEAKVIWVQRDVEKAIDSCAECNYKERGREVWDGIIRERWDNLEEHCTDDWLVITMEDLLKRTATTVDKIIKHCELDSSDFQRECAIDMAYDKKKTRDAKVLVTIPTRSRAMDLSLKKILEDIEQDERYDVTVEFPSYQPISNARNTIAKKHFLDKDYDFLLMMDHDNPPTRNPMDLVELNRDVLFLPTPIYQHNKLFYNILDVLPDEKWGVKNFKPIPPHRHVGLQRIEGAGTGCVLIARRVLEDLEAPFSEIFNEEGIRIRGEDMAFCRKATKAGWKLWTHWDYKCHHIKEMDLLKVIRFIEKLEK